MTKVALRHPPSHKVAEIQPVSSRFLVLIRLRRELTFSWQQKTPSNSRLPINCSNYMNPQFPKPVMKNKPNRIKPKRRRSQQVSYQTLEDRNVLSANPIISLDGGTLTIDGSSGDDTVYVRIAGGEVQASYRTDGSDFRTEYFPQDEVTDFRFNGGDGDDHIVNRTTLTLVAYGNRGNDRLIGGRGNDELHGGPGDDVLNGFIGDDSLHGDYGNDILSGWHGNDELYGWYGDDVILGGTGDDYISGYVGNDWADAGDGDDVLRGHEGNDHLIGGNGDDEIYGFTGHDHLYGGEGDDYISGYTGSDFIAGAGGDDILKGHEGVDRIFGGDGDDLLYGWHGNDLLNGMAGDDEIWGGDGDDNLRGEAGDDILHGDTGNDWIHGGDGNDILFGFFGNDRLVGGHGNDILCGGFGKDSYGEIEDGDAGYDPDSLFQSRGDNKSDQLLSDEAAEVFEEYSEQLKERADKIAESLDDLNLNDLNFGFNFDSLDDVNQNGFDFESRDELRLTFVNQQQFAFGFGIQNDSGETIENWAVAIKGANYKLDVSQLTNQDAFVLHTSVNDDGTIDYLFEGTSAIRPFGGIDGGNVEWHGVNFGQAVSGSSFEVGVLVS